MSWSGLSVIAQSPAAERCRGRWVVERARGSASELLDLAEPPDGAPRQARLHEVERPALVLGSAQSLDAADRRRASDAGVDVVRRRSGGGAVLLLPRRQVWADFFVPAVDPLWNDNIAAAAAWAGAVWSSVLDRFSSGTPTVFSGRLAADRWGRLMCFAGSGPGEVFVGGLKLVGVSQRRNRRRARIQTMARVSARHEPRPGTPPSSPPAVSGLTGAGLKALRRARGGHELNHSPAQDLTHLTEADLMALSPQDRSEARAALESRCGTIDVTVDILTESLLSTLENQG